MSYEALLQRARDLNALHEGAHRGAFQVIHRLANLWKIAACHLASEWAQEALGAAIILRE
ncbi:MAG TPA: hypothetical protein VFV38_24080 [Ktedonobacteraceae bacterium]|nr:hypothetical protein [Ktedonobacteraceae bacterium]